MATKKPKEELQVEASNNSRQSAVNRLKALGIDPTRLRNPGKKIEFISTGVSAIDLILGKGGGNYGVGKGTVIEIFGPSGSGKTHVALRMAAEHQKAGLKCAMMNAENAYYEPRAAALGVQVNNEDLWEVYENIGDAETYGELIKLLAKTGEYGLIIVDSVTALIPNDDYDKKLSDEARVGAHARFCGRLTQKLTEICSLSDTSVALLNQMRYGTIDKGFQKEFVIKSTGGEAIGFYAHTRLCIQKVMSKEGRIINTEGERVGGRSSAELFKNRYGEPGGETKFDIMFGDEEGDPLVEFIDKITTYQNLKEYATVTGRNPNKWYSYIDTGDPLKPVLAKSKDQSEFVRLLSDAPAPSNMNGNDIKDGVTTAFQFFARRLKIDETTRSMILQSAFGDIDGGEDDSNEIEAADQAIDKELSKVAKQYALAEPESE